MHEFSIATQILESVMEFAEAHLDKEIVTVRIEVGELMCVQREQLQFCYDSIKTNTSLQNSTLEISAVAAVVNCPGCHYEGEPKYWDGAMTGAPIATLQCPQCGKAAEAIQGNDCAIKSVQLSEARAYETNVE
jgi:hydrogenase nickel incorporation protein HypA/HybF